MNLILAIGTMLLFSSCALTKTQKGAAGGTVAGGAMGAVIGKASGNTALGAIIGAAAGGATGAVVGRQMDKQAEKIKATVPDAKVERIGEGIVVEFSSDILFAFDQSNLSYNSQNTLDKLVLVLKDYPDTNIEMQGHTDSKGSVNYNQSLSVRRATSVSHYLSGEGINTNRLTVKGFGETEPKYDNDTVEGRTQNRRAEFVITANEKMKAEAEKEALR